MAQNGPQAMSAVRSLSGGKRTSSGRHDLAENDPTETSAVPNGNVALLWSSRRLSR
jgi:hypothetical protein